MTAPLRRTRRIIAYSMLGLLSSIVAWMMLPGDILPLEQALAMTMVPSLVTGLIAFITGETYSDHSERLKND